MSQRHLFVCNMLVLTAFICQSAGCASVSVVTTSGSPKPRDRWVFNDKRYLSRNVALKAAHQFYEGLLSEIKETENKHRGKACVALPSRELLRVKVRWIRNLSWGVSRKQVEYEMTLLEMSDDNMVAALKKRGIFDAVIVNKSNLPEETSITGYEYLLYNMCQESGNAVRLWYIRTTSSEVDIPVHSSYTRGLKERVNTWLDSVEEVVNQQEAK